MDHNHEFFGHPDTVNTLIEKKLKKAGANILEKNRYTGVVPKKRYPTRTRGEIFRAFGTICEFRCARGREALSR